MAKNSLRNQVDPLQNHPLFGMDPTADPGTEPAQDLGGDEHLEPVDVDHAEDVAAADEARETRRGRLSRKRAAEVRPIRAPSGGSGLCVLGMALVLSGMALGMVLTSNPGTLGNLAAFLTTGVTPGSVVVAGFALLAAGFTIRATQPDASATDRLESALVRVEDSVEQLASTTPAIEGDELHQTLHLLQRQDEKINNLTRAIKMYGKPLVELGNASSDTLGGLREVQTGIKAITTSHKDLDRQLSELAVRVSEVHARQGKDEFLKLIRGQQEARTAQDASLSQLDSGIRKLTNGLDALTSQVNARLDAPAAGPDYDESFRGLQRELQGLATTLGNIQATYARSVPQSSPAAAARSAPKEPAPSPSLSDPAPTQKAPGGLAHSIAGTQQAKGGKNVLGAIAKLKQMRN